MQCDASISAPFRRMQRLIEYQSMLFSARRTNTRKTHEKMLYDNFWSASSKKKMPDSGRRRDCMSTIMIYAPAEVSVRCCLWGLIPAQKPLYLVIEITHMKTTLLKYVAIGLALRRALSCMRFGT